jgi:hypothetical protein
MQDLDLLKEHLDRMSEELTEMKKIAMRLETVDREKAEAAWKDLMLASEEISQRWEGPSAVEEIALQREKRP